MAYVPHIRLTMLGRLGGVTGPEQFSMNLSLARITGGSGPLHSLLGPNDAVWEDLANDCSNWFGSANANIQDHAVLTSVKFAPIGEDGKYTGPSIEKFRQKPGSVSLTSSQMRKPFQVALAATLYTAADIGRVKGRFYIPAPAIWVESDGRVGDAAAEVVETSVQTLVNNINNQPGIDVLGLGVVVASQGRRNKDGSVRVPPGNHTVTHVGVGRVLDTVRRRRNKLVESTDRSPVSA